MPSAIYKLFNRGFTLIELMLVVAILSMLAAIAIPKFANMVIKAKEAAVRGKLGTLRSGVSIYYADNEGRFPNFGSNNNILANKYLDEVPSISIPTQPSHVEGRYVSAQSLGLDWPNMGNRYVWKYDGSTGDVRVWCTHTDSNGTKWSLW
jgi:prepilin-type N-terminal cleavage/methylation domain-containing protein